MDFFSNRELSIIIWSGIALSFFLFKSEFRSHIPGLLKAAFDKKLSRVYLLTGIYTVAGIFILYKFNLWTWLELKDSIIWYIFSGLASLNKAHKMKNHDKFFQNAVKENIRFTILIEFIIGFYSFSLAWELVLVPVILFFILMQAVSGTDEKLKPLEKLSAILLGVGGLGLAVYSVFQAISHFNDFARLDTLRSLILSPFLALWFIPFIYGLALYMKYEVYFIAVGNAIENPGLKRFAKIYSLIKFNTDLEGMIRWKDGLFRNSVTDKAGIKCSIAEIKRLQKIEQNPPLVDPALGWSPYEAKDFLKYHGIITRYYINGYENEWSSTSNYLKLDDSFDANCISYYIRGNETIAKDLNLVLDVHRPQHASAAIDTFIDFADDLYFSAFNESLPDQIEEAVREQKNLRLKFPTHEVKLFKDDWLHQNKYTIKIYIEHV